MARILYGGSGADVIAQVSIDDGDLEPGSATFDVYTARTSGTHVTDLLDASSSPIDEVEPDASGRVLFYGVDGYSGPYYLQDQAAPSAERWLILPSNLPANVADLLSRVDDLESGGITGSVTIADVTGLAAALAALQPLDSDLTTIAGLTATTNNTVQAVGGAWASRTPTQAKTTLGLENVSNTSDATKNAATATLTNKTMSGASNTFTNIPYDAIPGLESDLTDAPDATGLSREVYWDSVTGWPLRSASGTTDPDVPVTWVGGTSAPTVSGTGATGAIGSGTAGEVKDRWLTGA